MSVLMTDSIPASAAVRCIHCGKEGTHRVCDECFKATASAAALGDAYVAVQKVHGDPKCHAYPPKPWYLNQYQWEAIACSCVLAPGHDGEQHACADRNHPRWF